MIKGVAVEKFSSCLDSSESESSSEETPLATTHKEPRKKTRYANWLVSALKLVKRLEGPMDQTDLILK